MTMSLEDAICIVLTLQNRPQTATTPEMRAILEVARRTVYTRGERWMKYAWPETNGDR